MTDYLRDPAVASRLAGEIRGLAHGKEINLMEVCGTHTVAIFRSGIRTLLPKGIRLLSGPGCPVCVTAVSDVDKAIALAGLPDVALATFGDMMRVPGSESSLSLERAKGKDIRIVYSPMDALKAAQEEPFKNIVFFATGFETTSPSVAATIKLAHKEGLKNFFVFCVHKLVPPALSALLSSPDVRVDGFILPGHVSSIIGSAPYKAVRGVASVIAGFEPVDILTAIFMLLRQIESGTPKVEIQYMLAVRPEGNPKAVALMNEVFAPCDSDWRGIGVIPASGLRLRDGFSGFDAEALLGGVCLPKPLEPKGCKCGEVLRGIKVPTECPLFGRACTPEHPVGACMVSTEGSCAAYYKYGGSDV